MLLKFRKLNRFGIEDWQAMLFVAFNQLFFLGLFLPIARSRLDLSAQQIKYTMVAIVLALLYVNNKYFLSNRQRRNAIIDEFRYLDQRKKKAWKWGAILSIPVLITIFITVLQLSRQ